MSDAGKTRALVNATLNESPFICALFSNVQGNRKCDPFEATI